MLWLRDVGIFRARDGDRLIAVDSLCLLHLDSFV